MSAKKTVKRPSKKDRDEAEMLVAYFKETLNEEDFRDFVERALNPAKAAEAERREEANRQLKDFISGIHNIPAGYALPEGFTENWELLIQAFEQQERERLTSNGIAPSKVDLLVKRGWIAVDVEKERLKSHPKIEPPPELHPIPSVLVQDGGHWRAPSVLTYVIKVHPFIRAFVENQPDLTVEQTIARAIKKAGLCRAEEDYYGTMLAESAEALELFLYEQMMGEPAEFGWMKSAKKSRQFWNILNAAIGFGRCLANYESFGDGSLDDLILGGLTQKRGRIARDTTFHILELMDAYRNHHGVEATAKKLLDWIGGKVPSATDEPLIFPDARADKFKGVTWDQWNNAVKNQKKKSK